MCIIIIYVTLFDRSFGIFRAVVVSHFRALLYQALCAEDAEKSRQLGHD